MNQALIPASSDKALRATAYRLIKEQILSCAFLPGAVLSEQSLAQSLGMSRTPVREALTQLAQESLVRVIPRRGALVAELSVQDMDEIFQLREALECWAVRQLAGNLRREELEFFSRAMGEARFDSGEDYDAAIKLDEEFHNFLVARTRNRRCQAVYGNVRDHDRRIRVLSTRQPGRLAATVAEHLQIIEALVAGDPGRASESMRQHIQNARMAAVHLS